MPLSVVANAAESHRKWARTDRPRGSVHIALRGPGRPLAGLLSVQVNTMPTNGLKTQGTAFNEPSGIALASPFGEFF